GRGAALPARGGGRAPGRGRARPSRPRGPRPRGPELEPDLAAVEDQRRREALAALGPEAGQPAGPPATEEHGRERRRDPLAGDALPQLEVAGRAGEVLESLGDVAATARARADLPGPGGAAGRR